MRDDAEFDAFYLAAAPRLTRQLYLATGDATRAQDCAQEAFIRAWRQWESLSAHSAEPYSWVRTVAWRLAVSDWRRALARLRALARHGSAVDVLEPSATAVAVRDALAQLPMPQRAALVLHYFADLTVEDVAQALGVPTGTVKARLARGRRALEPLLRDEEEKSWTTNG